MSEIKWLIDRDKLYRDPLADYYDCPYCSMPLIRYNVEIDRDGLKTWRHDHCNKVIKMVKTEIQTLLAPCPNCRKLCKHQKYENGIYIFTCDDCQYTGCHGFTGGGDGGIGK